MTVQPMPRIRQTGEDTSMDNGDLLKWLQKQQVQQGIKVTITGSGHYGIFRNDQLVTTVSVTPRGGKRSTLNAISQLRRSGINVPRKGQRT